MPKATVDTGATTAGTSQSTGPFPLRGKRIVVKDGAVEFGAEGSAPDVNLYRSAADTLKTDDALAVVGTLAVTGAATLSSTLSAGASTLTSLTQLRFGTAEACTIASGVLTVTRSFVRVTSESGTTDTVDTITKTDAADGDILILVPKATDTITYDDANIDLGAATRATAPGGVIVLLYNGEVPSWQEVVFLAASDNA